MQISLDGHVALVTGAARGNGRAFALALARVGAKVLVTDVIDGGGLDTVEAIRAEDGVAEAALLDVRDAAACAAVAAQAREAFGPVSILINNAGIMLRGGLFDDDAAEKWRDTIDVNVHGVFNVTQAVLEHLVETSGRVVNIASIRTFMGGADSAAYSASKGAIGQITKAMATELAPKGVRVNAIAPGIIETEMTAVTRASNQRLSAYLSTVPLGRCGTPEDLVGPMLLLVSDFASYMTGAIVPVDGGKLAA